MGELIKIREASLRYDISARALKYYEDIGLIKSTRSDDYAYRLYDETAVKRLEHSKAPASDGRVKWRKPVRL